MRRRDPDHLPAPRGEGTRGRGARGPEVAGRADRRPRGEGTRGHQRAACTQVPRPSLPKVPPTHSAAPDGPTLTLREWAPSGVGSCWVRRPRADLTAPRRSTLNGKTPRSVHASGVVPATSAASYTPATTKSAPPAACATI